MRFMSDSPYTIAVFDFDKTITNCDSLIPFLINTNGFFKTVGRLFFLIPYFVQYFFKKLSRQQLKEKILSIFFKGMPLSQLESMGHYYADHHIDRWIKPEAIRRLKWHQDQGHRCILASASLNIYLNSWAKRYEFDDIISSSLQVDRQGNITGKLNGRNCWGPEKKRRLLRLIGTHKKYDLYVYGDSQGDQDMLEMADHPFYRRFE